MTVDVDGWSSLLRFYGVNHNVSKADLHVDIENGVSQLITLFEKHGILATFFVTGEMARRHPNIVNRAYRKGHEVACHGFFHGKDECLSDIDEQEHNIKEATGIIEELTGHMPVGFRAPCLRANRETFHILSELGYLYDSSIIPTFIPGYYGQLNWRFRPYWIKTTKEKKIRPLLEIPVSVNPFFFIPISAAWMRNLGANWVKFGIKMNFFFNNPLVFYIHPRDVLSLPRVKGVPWHLYRNVGFSTIKILDEILRYAKTHNAIFLRAADLAFPFYKDGVFKF